MNGELRARVADQYLMSRRLGEVEQLLAETPTIAIIFCFT